MANGYVIYEGPSVLDGSPIVAILTDVYNPSRNAKTGDMLQTWILRADMHPAEATRSGADASICGDCRHRPANEGTCYVNLHWAPSAVWRAYAAGKYPKVPHNKLSDLGAQRMVRLGSYGDPAAVPLTYWRYLTLRSLGWTGYTHQWRRPDARDFQAFVMASVESEAEALEARKAKWRTFRVRAPGGALMGRNEIVCPAAKEAGQKTTCEACKACMGTTAKARVNVAITAHGAHARRFKEA